MDKKVTLRELEERVKNNADRKERLINHYEISIRNKNLNKGRVRPKHPTEVKILAKFTDNGGNE